MAVRVKTLKRTTVEPGWSVTLTVPCVVKSEMNLREHWAARHRRFKSQAEAVRLMVVTAFFNVEYVPDRCRVTLTRLGGKTLDSGNLESSFKGVQDAVARHILEMDDGDPRLTWEYRQEPGGPQGVRIALESGG